MPEPKDVKVTLELSAADCGNLIMGMNATIQNHCSMCLGDADDHYNQIKEFEALRDKIKAKLKEVGY